MIKKAYFVLLIPNKQTETNSKKVVLVRATNERSAEVIALNNVQDCSVEVYTKPQMMELGSKWLLQKAPKNKRVNYLELLSLENHSFDGAKLKANLYRIDSKLLVNFILFLANHNLKLQRELGLDSDEASQEYQRGILALFTKIAECLENITEISLDESDMKNHIDSILNYVKLITIATRIPEFRSIRYLLNPHLKVIMSKVNELV